MKERGTNFMANTLSGLSNDIEALKKVANKLSDWLHEDLKGIIKLLGTVPKIPDILRDFKEVMVKQFTSLFKNQMEAIVISRQANIRVAKKKIELLNDQIEKRTQQLSNAQSRIKERYQNLSIKLISQHQSFLRQLDSHAFEITERIYPEVVQKSFSYKSIPTSNYIIAHAQESAIVRFNILRERFLKAQKEIGSFLDMRSAIYDQIEEAIAENYLEGEYFIPFYEVEIEDIDTGSKRTELLFYKSDDEFEIEEIKVDNELYSAAEDIVSRRRSDKKENNLIKEEIIDSLSKKKAFARSELERFIQNCKIYDEREAQK